MAFDGVGGEWFGAVALFEDFVLEAAGECGDSFSLCVVGEVGFAFGFELCVFVFFELREVAVEDYAGFAGFDLCFVALEDVGEALGEGFDVDVGGAALEEVGADVHADGVACFFHVV